MNWWLLLPVLITLILVLPSVVSDIEWNVVRKHSSMVGKDWRDTQESLCLALALWLIIAFGKYLA